MQVYIKSATAISPQQSFSGKLPDEAAVVAGNRLACIEPDYKEYIDAALRRRMSRIIKMGVAAAVKCLHEANLDQPDAIITATGLGCLSDTEVFMNSILENNESLTSPTAFIQSTFNTIGAQIALMLKNHNYNFTYVHRGFSFESALLDAMMQIGNHEASNILVGGIDELTNTSYSIMQRMGFWKTNLIDNSYLFDSKTRGSMAGEGSTFFVLSKHSSSDCPRLSGLNTFYKPDGNKEIEKRIADFLESKKLTPKDIHLLILGKSGDYKLDEPYRFLQENLLQDIPVVCFKHLCGEYHTASAFALWLGATILINREVPEAAVPKYGEIPENHSVKRILIYNHYRNINHSLMLLEL
jgi:3-oxoacyl-[acyl-carrier-protein] synthase II